VAVVLVIAAAGALVPKRVPRVALVLPFFLFMGQLGYFERVREFIRKPMVIEEYLYANGIRVDAYPLLQEQGVLSHGTYVPMRAIT
jgi:hypothetical protein